MVSVGNYERSESRRKSNDHPKLFLTRAKRVRALIASSVTAIGLSVLTRASNISYIGDSVRLT